MPDQILGQWAHEFARLVGVALEPIRQQVQAIGTRIALIERRLDSIEALLGGGNGGGTPTVPSTPRSELPTIPPPHSDEPP